MMLGPYLLTLLAAILVSGVNSICDFFIAVLGLVSFLYSIVPFSYPMQQLSMNVYQRYSSANPHNFWQQKQLPLLIFHAILKSIIVFLLPICFGLFR